MKKKKKFPVEIFITFVFFAACLYYIQKTDLRVDTSLSIDVKAFKRDILRLYVDKGKSLKGKVRRSFHPVSFNLPRRDIKGVRLMLGEKPGTFVIKSIKIKTPFKHHEWSGEITGKIFRFSGTNLRDKAGIKDEYLYIRSSGQKSILPLEEEVVTIINRLSREKLFFYPVALLLSLFFFYFIHYLNLKNLKIFFTPRVLLNMVLLFILIISFPILNDIFNITKDIKLHRLQEKRAKAKMPDFRFDSLFSFLAGYKHYYNDHFELRNLLIPLHNYTKVKAFGISPIPMVMIGKGGWLYLAKQNERVDEIEYYRSVKLFSPEELEHWRTSLESRWDWLAKRGIHYLFVIAPNKSTIYPEYLPDYVRPVHKQSRLDQLVDYLKKHSQFSLLDLREVMFAAKKERRVYRKTDSHWNRYGAYLAYREIMKALSNFFADAHPVDIGEFDVYVQEKHGGDLAIMLSLQKSIYKDRVIEVDHLQPLNAKDAPPLKKKYPGVNQGVKENPAGKLPGAIMVHDSFANRVQSFLSEHFSRIVYLRDWGLNFYTELIKKEQPKVVIEQMAERFLMSKIPSPAPRQ